MLQLKSPYHISFLARHSRYIFCLIVPPNLVNSVCIPPVRSSLPGIVHIHPSYQTVYGTTVVEITCGVLTFQNSLNLFSSPLFAVLSSINKPAPWSGSALLRSSSQYWTGRMCSLSRCRESLPRWRARPVVGLCFPVLCPPLQQWSYPSMYML